MAFGKKVRVGLDIGYHSVKAVVVEVSGHRYRVLHRGVRPLWDDSAMYNPDGPKRSQIGPVVIDLFRSFKISPRKQKDVRSLVDSPQVAAKEISAIPLEEREMASAMLMEARKHIPLDGSETQIDYQILGAHPEEQDKVRVLLVGSSKKSFENHLSLLREVDIRPTIVDVEPLAIANAYMAFNELPEEGLVVLLDIGCRKTSIILLGRKDRFFTREVNVGGAVFTEDLMNQYGLKFEEAERVKAEQGLKPDLARHGEGEEGLRLANKNVLERFGDEVNRTLRYYVKETGQSHFNKFILVGGGSALNDLQEYLQTKFRADVEQYDPFAQMEMVGGNGDGHPGQYAAAVGLAIREL
jgi:type IV pilus assembly protein PilM